MPGNETYLGRRIQKTQLCTPFPMSTRQLEILQMTADGLELGQIASRLGVEKTTVRDQRNKLSSFGIQDDNIPLLPMSTTLAVLLQDGINECYLSQRIENPKPIELTPFEEVVIQSACSDERQKDFMQKTQTPERNMWGTQMKIRKKLRTKNINHTIARYTWLKNRGYIKISEGEVDEAPPSLRPTQTELLDLLANGLNTEEVRGRLVLSRSAINTRYFSFKNITQPDINTDPNVKPRDIILRLIRQGVWDGTIAHALATDQVVNLTTFEESLIQSIYDNETSEQFAERNGLSLYSVSQAKKKLNEKLSTRTPLHLIARRTALEKAGLLEITD